MKKDEDEERGRQENNIVVNEITNVIKKKLI